MNIKSNLIVSLLRCRAIGYFSISALSIVATTACADLTFENAEITTPNSHPTQSVMLRVSSNPSSRTSLDDDMQTTNWCEDDKIALWATKEGEEEFSLEATPFSLFYYGSNYDSAVFTAEVAAMDEGNYTYYATYPLPKATDGSHVTFSLPENQSGKYDGVADIMLSRAITAGALNEDANKSCALRFNHLTHAIRIEVPKDKDLLGGTSRLKIDFPTEVVGDVTFDLKDNTATSTLTNSSKTIVVNLDNEITESGYVWAFINPTEIDGDIVFTGYTAGNASSKTVKTSLSSHMLEAGRVTPIRLTIPSEQPKEFILKIDKNCLGESIQKVHLKAPKGALFEGDKDSITINTNSDGEYRFRYMTSLYDKAFKASGITSYFESEHAIVKGETIKITSAHDLTVNNISLNVPYLFEEDFSGISEDGEYKGLLSQSLPGLSHIWTGGKIYEYWKGKGVAIKSYLFKLFFSSGTYDGEIKLSLKNHAALKANAEVDLTLTFDADWRPNKCPNMNLVIFNDNNSSKTIALSRNSSASENSTKTTRTITLENTKTSSIITWRTNGGKASSAYEYDPIFIDNIKIAIK